MMSHILKTGSAKIFDKFTKKGHGQSDTFVVSYTHTSVHWVVTQQLHEVYRLSPEVGVSQVSTYPAPARRPPKDQPTQSSTHCEA